MKATNLPAGRQGNKLFWTCSGIPRQACLPAKQARLPDGQACCEVVYSAIDVRLKFSLTLNYKTLNSRNNQDFYLKFKSVYPGTIKDWQTDNGLENLGEFEDQLKKDSVPHFFTYPRCSKINGIIERYQRTFQEEFLNSHLNLIHNKISFNQITKNWQNI